MQCSPSGSGFWTWLPTSWRTSGSATLSRWTGGSFWTVASKLHGALYLWFATSVSGENINIRWDQMWLNEGFAEYLSNIASHSIDPEIHTWERCRNCLLWGLVCKSTMKVLRAGDPVGDVLGSRLKTPLGSDGPDHHKVGFNLTWIQI